MTLARRSSIVWLSMPELTSKTGREHPIAISIPSTAAPNTAWWTCILPNGSGSLVVPVVCLLWYLLWCLA